MPCQSATPSSCKGTGLIPPADAPDVALVPMFIPPPDELLAELPAGVGVLVVSPLPNAITRNAPISTPRRRKPAGLARRSSLRMRSALTMRILLQRYFACASAARTCSSRAAPVSHPEVDTFQ